MSPLTAASPLPSYSVPIPPYTLHRAALVYGAPAVPFSQPRNVIGGHLLAAVVGITSFKLLAVPMGTAALAAPVAVAGSIMGMLATRTMHPPAGGTTLIAVVGGAQVTIFTLSVTLVVLIT